MITKLIIVAVGGSAGSVLRYLVFLLFDRYHATTFPWATLAVNLIGSLMIGFLWGLFDRVHISPGIRLLLFIGLLGGFTTFSTFAFDIFSLYRDGDYKMMITYLLSSNILSIGFAFLGYGVSRMF
jgi:CrcB protein